MLANDEIIYKKAYKELYEVICILTQDEISKIPQYIIENIKKKMDNTYKFSIDKNKSILEQDLMPETQALIIELYQRYLSPEEEKEKWNKYNQMCYEKSELQKSKKYNPDNLFKKKNIIPESNQLIVLENKSFIQKIIDKIKKTFKKKDGK